MAILNNSNAISSAGGYDINNSLRFRASASAYLNRTFGSTYTDKTKSTVSFWVKRGSLNINNGHTIMWYNASGASGHITFAGSGAGGTLVNDCLNFSNRNATTGSGDYGFQTTQLFRDPSAWYHIIIVFDTGQATSTNRVKLYVNGTQVTAFVSTQYPSQNYQTTAFLGGNSAAHIIGYGATTGATEYFDGYLADFNFIDGQALTPSSFGETDTTTGVWKPKAYTGTYGTNGFYLKFSDIATTSGSNAGLGKDFSGNTNYWTTNNISVTSGTTYDAMTDSPTLTSATVANYCVLNPLDIIPSRTLPVISGGNLDASNGGSGDDLAHGTIAVSSGKWYFEMVAGTVPSSNTHFVGWQVPVPSPINGGLYRNNGVIYDFSATTTSAPTYTANDIIGCIVDVDAGKVWFSKNGTYVNSGDPAAGTNPAYTFTAGTLITPALAFDNIASTCTASVNFGQRPFSYTPPTGYKALNTYNLPTSTIVKGNSYMDAVLWTGDGTSSKTVSSYNFAPDFLWGKNRTTASIGWWLYDTTRGAGNNKELATHNDLAEGADNEDTYGYLSAFTSNGFTGVNGTGSPNYYFNQSSATYVAYGLKANGGTTSSNTQGSITSTVQANTTAGFSVVTYTGTGANATVGHGLGVAPKMIIVKKRSGANDWVVYTKEGVPNAGYYLRLNLTNGQTYNTAVFQGTHPTSTVFSIGTDIVNDSSGTYVAYCFAEIAGFSKFGSYVGNANADGPFIYTGFRPKFVMFKRIDSTGSWEIQDTSRSDYNVISKELYANLSDAEYDDIYNNSDFLANGFKIRSGASSGNNNPSGGTVIYAAFAENPFKNANAR